MRVLVTTSAQFTTQVGKQVTMQVVELLKVFTGEYSQQVDIPEQHTNVWLIRSICNK